MTSGCVCVRSPVDLICRLTWATTVGYCSSTTGKLLTSSDIHNLKASVNRQCPDVTSVLKEHTSQYPNDDIGLVVDDNNAVQLIFIQTQQMKETFAKFPEVLLLDGTYSTNNCGMPLYSFLAEDGYGQGQIVGMFLLNGEGTDQISTMVTAASWLQ